MPILESILNPDNYTGNALRATIRLKQAGASPVSMQYRAVLLNNQQVSAGQIVAAFNIPLESQINVNTKEGFRKEQLLKTILDTMDVAFIAIDTKGMLTALNRVARE